jgi:hypothetical protein
MGAEERKHKGKAFKEQPKRFFVNLLFVCSACLHAKVQRFGTQACFAG